MDTTRPLIVLFADSQALMHYGAVHTYIGRIETPSFNGVLMGTALVFSHLQRHSIFTPNLEKINIRKLGSPEWG